MTMRERARSNVTGPPRKSSRRPGRSPPRSLASLCRRRRMTRRPEAEPAIRFLGLAARAGAVVTGTDRVRSAVRRGEIGFAIVAADASANTKDKLIPLLRARGVPHTVGFSRHELGEAVGRAPL